MIPWLYGKCLEGKESPGLCGHRYVSSTASTLFLEKFAQVESGAV